MADILRLTRALQDGSAYTSVDLLTTDAFKLQAFGWKTRTPAMEGTYSYNSFGAQADFDHYGVVTDTIPIVGQGTVAAMAARMNLIEDMLDRARRYNEDPVLNMPVWIEWQVDGEGGTRRSLVYEGSIHIASTQTTSGFMEGGKIIANLVITRHPFWENSTVIPDPSSTPPNISASGGWQDISGVAGTAPARIEQVSVLSTNGSATPITRIWIGVRPEYNGTDDFTSEWQCEYGTMGTDASVNAGGYVDVSFSTTATPLTERVGVTAQQAIPGSGISYADMAGRYLVLCRCQVTSGTIGIQMRHGYSGSSAMEQGNEIFLTNTSYQLFELGQVQIPPSAIGYGGGLNVYIRKFEIQIWAERVSGSGSLYLDELILIPSEHFMYMDGISCSTASGSTTMLTRENDVVTALGASGGDIDVIAEHSETNWYLPVGNSIQVVAAQRSTSHVKTDIIWVVNQYYPRWHGYRGS